MMSPFVIQIFAFMGITFLLGIVLGWLVWRYDGVSQKALGAASSEVDFWRSNLEESRVKLGYEQNKTLALTEEKAALKKRIASLEDMVRAARS